MLKMIYRVFSWISILITTGILGGILAHKTDKYIDENWEE